MRSNGPFIKQGPRLLEEYLDFLEQLAENFDELGRCRVFPHPFKIGDEKPMKPRGRT